MRRRPKKIIKNIEIDKKLISGITEAQPIIGGIAPAAPPITILREVVLLSHIVYINT